MPTDWRAPSETSRQAQAIGFAYIWSNALATDSIRYVNSSRRFGLGRRMPLSKLSEKRSKGSMAQTERYAHIINTLRIWYPLLSDV